MGPSFLHNFVLWNLVKMNVCNNKEVRFSKVNYYNYYNNIIIITVIIITIYNNYNIIIAKSLV